MISAQAVTLPPVAPQLMRPIRRPLCELSAKESYTVNEVRSSLLCWRAAWGNASGRFDALRAAVSVREKAAATLAKGDKS